MRLCTRLLTALAALATVDAMFSNHAPHAIPATGSKKRATILSTQRSGPGRTIADHMNSAYSKHNLVMSPALAETLKGSAYNSPVGNDLFYNLLVTVGGRSLKLDLDTGSSDLWVWSLELPLVDFYFHNGGSFYDPILSNTSYCIEGSTFNISYGIGEAWGVVCRDNVVIAGIEAHNFTIGLATHIDDDAVHMSSDGLLGMGLPVANTIHPHVTDVPFWHDVIGDLEEPLFTVDLKRNHSGAYGFGFIDKDRFYGDITYLSANPFLKWWTINVSGYRVASTEWERSFQAIVDTGTTYTLLPDNLLKNYFSQVPGATEYFERFGVYHYDCDVDLPALSIVFEEGYVAVIHPSYITYAQVSPGWCMSGFQPRGPTIGHDHYTLGDNFLVSQFAVFKARPVYQVGFAPKPLDIENAAWAGFDGVVDSYPRRWW